MQNGHETAGSILQWRVWHFAEHLAGGGCQRSHGRQEPSRGLGGETAARWAAQPQLLCDHALVLGGASFTMARGELHCASGSSEIALRRSAAAGSRPPHRRGAPRHSHVPKGLLRTLALASRRSASSALASLPTSTEGSASQLPSAQRARRPGPPFCGCASDGGLELLVLGTALAQRWAEAVPCVLLRRAQVAVARLCPPTSSRSGRIMGAVPAPSARTPMASPSFASHAWPAAATYYRALWLSYASAPAGSLPPQGRSSPLLFFHGRSAGRPPWWSSAAVQMRWRRTTERDIWGGRRKGERR